MKKLIMAACTLCAAAALQSCLNTDNENHGTYIYTNVGNGITELYADQVEDSLHVVSYDSWTARTQMLDGGDWFTVSDLKCNVPVGYIVTQTVLCKTTPNNTGQVRTGVLYIDSAFPEYGALSTYIYQYYWLNISVPQATFENKENETPRVKFADTLNATDNLALFACRVYADATLASDVDWLSIKPEDQRLKPGSYGLKFVVSPNTTSEDREAHVTLTSNGVSNVVTYTQKGKK